MMSLHTVNKMQGIECQRSKQQTLGALLRDLTLRSSKECLAKYLKQTSDQRGAEKDLLGVLISTVQGQNNDNAYCAP